MNTNVINEEELNGILAEVEANDFCNCAVKKNIVKVDNNMNIAQKKNKSIKINKDIVQGLGKTVALMVVAGACGYFELAKPLLYASVELACLCVVCFKLGEFKGKNSK